MLESNYNKESKLTLGPFKFVLIGVLSALLIFVVVMIGYNIKLKKEVEANNKMFCAVDSFEADKLDEALNGNELNYGLLDIISKYNGTKAAKLASVYAGIIYMNKGDYDNAIKYLLQALSIQDFLVKPRIMAMLGDAYTEKADYKSAIKYFKLASNLNPNEWFTPKYICKEAIVHEKVNDYNSALSCYNSIVNNFKNSSYYDNAIMHISRLDHIVNKVVVNK